MARKITNREITGSVARREDFQANSASGTVLDSHALYGGPGLLPGDWARKLSSDLIWPGVEYIVQSYATPIAWVLTDGTAVVPAVKYSVTTSKAQSAVRAGLRDVPVVEKLPA